MEVRLFDYGDRPLSAALWKEAFNDSDEFISWYLDNKAESSLGMFDGGELVSALHIVPYTILVQGLQLPTAFIAGAATSKKHRGKGHMRRLLYEALVLLKSRGVLITHLYPFKHSFYENYGWATYSYVSRQTVTEAFCKSGTDVIETMEPFILSTLYNRMMRGYEGYIIRGEREWRWRLDELAIDGGRSAVLLKHGTARAYMLFYNDNGKASIIETVYEDEEDIAALLGYILRQGFSSAEYFVPHNGKEKFGMARIVDAYGLLSVLGAQSMLERTSVKDNFAHWNNIGERDGYSIDISSLALYTHTGSDLKTAEKLGFYFKPKSTCIFETY